MRYEPWTEFWSKRLGIQYSQPGENKLVKWRERDRHVPVIGPTDDGICASMCRALMPKTQSCIHISGVLNNTTNKPHLLNIGKETDHSLDVTLRSFVAYCCMQPIFILSQIFFTQNAYNKIKQYIHRKYT